MNTADQFLSLAKEVAAYDASLNWMETLSASYRLFLLFNGLPENALRDFVDITRTDNKAFDHLWDSSSPLADISQHHDTLLGFTLKREGNQTKVLSLKGSDRKRKGAYYTPLELVEFTLDRSLTQWTATGLDQPTICDPACGVGHFLLPAANRLILEQVKEKGISRIEAATWVVENCIYGIDLDPIALSICKLRLCRLTKNWNTKTNLVCKDALLGPQPHIQSILTSFSSARNLSNGFDLVIGNPPWERIKLSEKEFFSQAMPFIATLPTKSKRMAEIHKLKVSNPVLYNEYSKAKKSAIDYAAAIRSQYPHCGKGDSNLYAPFAELAYSLLADNGQCGLILPTGIVSDKTYSSFLQLLVYNNHLEYVFGFDSKSKLFKSISMQFCILGFSKRLVKQPKFAFQLRTVDEIKPQKIWSVSNRDIFLCNPNTKTLPNFNSAIDAKIVIKAHQDFGVWESPNSNPWGLHLSTQYHMSAHSHLFHTEEHLIQMGAVKSDDENTWHVFNQQYIPLLEGKSIHHFTTKNRPPRYWVNSEIAYRNNAWCLAYRWIARNTDKRTLISTLAPAYPAGNSIGLIRVQNGDLRWSLALLTLLNSYAIDYIIRQKLAGANVTFGVLKQLPIPSPEHIASSQLFGADPVSALASYAKVRLLEANPKLEQITSFSEVNGNFERVDEMGIMSLMNFDPIAKKRVIDHFGLH